MDSEARELLKVVYFKPLRDAQGNNTKHKRETDYDNLKKKIENYFRDGGNSESITGENNSFLRRPKRVTTQLLKTEEHQRILIIL